MLAFFSEMMTAFAAALAKVLPLSPFQQYIKEFANLPYLGYLNWFLPIRAFVNIGLAWLGCIAIFYIYSIAMRWVKVIGD